MNNLDFITIPDPAANAILAVTMGVKAGERLRIHALTFKATNGDAGSGQLKIKLTQIGKGFFPITSGSIGSGTGVTIGAAINMETSPVDPSSAIYVDQQFINVRLPDMWWNSEVSFEASWNGVAVWTFTNAGMWVEYQRPLHKPLPTGGA